MATNIARQGVHCVIAAGNSGAQGLFYAAAPANGEDVISVGSVANAFNPIVAIQGRFAADVEPENRSFGYIPSTVPFPANASGYPLYALNFDITNPADACTALPANTTSLAEKIVLIRRGTCDFVTKITNVRARGAQFVIFYNNESPLSRPASLSGVLAAMVSADQGAEWITYLAEKQLINLYFADAPSAEVIYTPNTIAGGTMNTFSSWSPTYELNIKPEVSAPGGNILSTYPIPLGSYSVSSGTSMATPYISGVLALYLNAHGLNRTRDYQLLRKILSTTSTPLPFNDGTRTYPYLAPVIQQGGGLVNAYAVVHYTTLISPSILSLNDSAYSNQTVTFTISNNDPTAVSYTITHKPAATAYALDVITTLPSSFPPELNTESATVIISFDNVTVPAQSSTTISVTFARPTSLETKRIPVFSGYIHIQSGKNESFHLPYAGVAGNMKEVMITDFEQRAPYIARFSDVSAIPSPIENGTVFDMTADLPEFNWRMVMGSSVVRIDILGNGSQTEAVGVNILGAAAGSPFYWLPRISFANVANRYSFLWSGMLNTGEQVPAGTYQLFYRALKIFGDPNNNSDYENWISPPFSIVYGTSLNNSTSTQIPTTTITTTASTTTTTPIPVTTTTPPNKGHSSLKCHVQFAVFLLVLCFLRLQ